MINSSYFASAWFITIFTNTIKSTVSNLQQQPSEDSADASDISEGQAVVSEHLLQLWDYFLIVGWKAILKMGLYVLKDSGEELL